MTESEWYEITYKKTIIEYIDSLSDKKLIDEEHIPTNAARFSENLLNLVSFTTPKGRIYSKEVIDAFFSEFETFLKSTPIPKSITLYQYFLVFILEEKQLNAPQQGFHLCVSGEVTDLFPKVRQKLGSHLLFQFDQK